VVARYGRRQFLAGGLGSAVALLLAQGNPDVAEAVAASNHRSLYIVAHADDTLLFINPDVYLDIAHGLAVQTVFLTAGDHGLGPTYWQDRELGVLAAFAYMVGLANSWIGGTVTANGHALNIQTLAGRPRISVIFMRLPDGNLNGSGFASDSHESLEQLWKGSAPSLNAVDGSTSYAMRDLVDTIASLMIGFDPSLVRTQDYVGTYGDGDHSDHYSTAYFTQAAHRKYNRAKRDLIGYLGYPVVSKPANIRGSALQQKYDAFLAYAQYDSLLPDTQSQLDGVYGEFMARQYPVGRSPVIIKAERDKSKYWQLLP